MLGTRWVCHPDPSCPCLHDLSNRDGGISSSSTCRSVRVCVWVVPGGPMDFLSTPTGVPGGPREPPMDIPGTSRYVSGAPYEGARTPRDPSGASPGHLPRPPGPPQSLPGDPGRLSGKTIKDFQKPPGNPQGPSGNPEKFEGPPETSPGTLWGLL